MNEEYLLLMQVANNPKLMDTFYQMLEDHFSKHKRKDRGDCLFCELFLNW